MDYADFVIGSLQYWTLYTITARANSNFIQGTGLSYSEKSVQIMWADL